MLKWIKRIKQKRLQKKMAELEVVMALANICLYLDYEGQRGCRNPYARFMHSHASGLTFYAGELRKEVRKDEKVVL